MPSLRGFSMSHLLNRGQMRDCLRLIDVIIKIGLCQGKSRPQEALCVHSVIRGAECMAKRVMIYTLSLILERYLYALNSLAIMCRAKSIKSY